MGTWSEDVGHLQLCTIQFDINTRVCPAKNRRAALTTVARENLLRIGGRLRFLTGLLLPLFFFFYQVPCKASEGTAELAETSTAELIETVLHDVSFWKVLAHNNLQDGFNALIEPKIASGPDLSASKDLTGEVTAAARAARVKELLSRKDAGKELLAKYRAMPPISGSSSKQQGSLDGEAYRRLCVIELVLTQYGVLENLGKTQRRYLLLECLAKHEHESLKEQGGNHKIFASLLLGRIMKREQYTPFIGKVRIRKETGLRNFLAAGPQVEDPSVLNEIVVHARRFREQYPIAATDIP